MKIYGKFRSVARRRPVKVLIAVALLVLSFVILAVPRLGLPGNPPLLTYTLTPVPTLGGRNAQPLGINDHGHVVGHSNNAAGAEHAFLWDEMTGVTDLGVLGGTRSCAQAVNDAQQVTGWSHDPNANDRAFFWDPRLGMRDLGTLGGNSSYGEDINEAGQVVGYAAIDKLTKSLFHAFLWEQNRGMVDLGTLGGKTSIAYAVNDYGQVVGVADTNDCKKHAFLWDEDTGMIDLTLLGIPGVSSKAWDINNQGQVLGTFNAANGEKQLFFWDPSQGVTTCDLPADGGVHRLKFNDTGQIVLLLWHWGRRFLWFRFSSTHTTSHVLTWNGTEITLCRQLPQDAEFYGFWDINNEGQIAGRTQDNGPVVLTFDELERRKPR